MQSQPQYRRVPSRDETSGGGVNSPIRRESHAVAGRNIPDRIADKIVAIIWVTIAVLVAYWTNFYSVIFSSDKANRTLLRGALVCFVVNTALFLYLNVYLPQVKQLKDSSAWPVYCPKVIPIMTILGVICTLLLVRGTWPVWGFWAPLLLGVEFMGILFSLHLIPAKCVPCIL